MKAGHPTKTTNIRATMSANMSGKIRSSRKKGIRCGGSNDVDQEQFHFDKTVHAPALEVSVAASLSYKPPSYPKTSEEEMFLYSALSRNFLFRVFSQQELFPAAFSLIEAMERVKFSVGEVIIKQGDKGDYFYVIAEGTCIVQVDGTDVSLKTIEKGASFGELALMYSSPRAATITAREDVVLFRVDQRTFRLICQAQSTVAEFQKRDRLGSVPFLAELSEADKLKLAEVMTLRVFKKGDILQERGHNLHKFWIIDQGKLKLSQMEVSGTKLEDICLEEGDNFGGEALIADVPTKVNVEALTDGRVFTMEAELFKNVIGDMNTARRRSLSLKWLESIRVIKNTSLNTATLECLVKLLRSETFDEGDCIMTEGEPVEAALYILRGGSIHLTSETEDNKMEKFGFFGEDMLTLDAKRRSNGPSDSTIIKAPYTVKVTSDCGLLVLRLSDCRKVFDTTNVGKGGAMYDSVVVTMLTLEDFKRHAILGQGSFGQVWLASRITSSGTMERFYALKIQSKAHLVKQGQARSAVREKTIMSELNHPFITRVLSSFQDDRFVYMLMDLIRGGELEGIMHGEETLSESSLFYAAGILEALAYMHRNGYIYRDLKPQNVLISDDGYPVLTDFGFAKKVKTKTFTFCGTPFYLAPEIILNRGHGFAADYWSLGILIYEMVTGATPFEDSCLDQVDLFRSIVMDEVVYQTLGMSGELELLLKGLLFKNPYQRLGSLANGVDDIFNHAWFQEIDFSDLCYKKIKAPHIPLVGDPFDTSKFGDWSLEQDILEIESTCLMEDEEDLFISF